MGWAVEARWEALITGAVAGLGERRVRRGRGSVDQARAGEEGTRGEEQEERRTQCARGYEGGGQAPALYVVRRWLNGWLCIVGVGA